LGSWALGLLDLERIGLLGICCLGLSSEVGVVTTAMSLLPFCGPTVPIGCKVVRLDPLVSWALGLLGPWALVGSANFVFNLPQFLLAFLLLGFCDFLLLGAWTVGHNNSTFVAIVGSAFSPLSFCGPSVPIGCKVLRQDPLGS
jgi:hypothetical protein